MNEKRPRIVSKQTLVDMGFTPSHGDFFFVFDIIDIEHPVDIHPDMVLPNVKAKYDPYFLPLSNIMQPRDRDRI